MPSRPDTLAKHLLDRGKLLVDLDTGAITNPNGKRVEHVDKRMGYGRVIVLRKPMTWAMAHRIVWVAAHGLIPDGLQINHRNRLRWDNQLANLELVAPQGNARHWRDYGYDAVDPEWLARLDKGERPDKSINPYGYNPRADWSLFC